MNGALLLWAATVRTKSFDERLRAAGATGAREMSMFPIDYKHFYGVGTHRIGNACAVGGCRHPCQRDRPAHYLDSAIESPAWDERGGPRVYRIQRRPSVSYRGVMGAESINAIESFGAKLERERIVESFAGLCDRARARGLRVSLEFMPFSAIKDLETAWDVVRLADRKNGSITFDTWHYFRGTRNDELLRTIPREKIFRVQLADSLDAVQGSLMNDLLHFRLPPREGDF